MATSPPDIILTSAPIGASSKFLDPIRSNREGSLPIPSRRGISHPTRMRVIGKDFLDTDQTDLLAFFDGAFDGGKSFRTVLAGIAGASKTHWFGRAAKPSPFLSEPIYPQRHPKGWLSKLDRIVTELGRLKEGWDGQGAEPVSQTVLMDLETALFVLPSETREPEVEVDGSDGSVALRWWVDGGEAAFALIFTGNGKVHGVMSSMNEAPPPAWCHPVGDETKILDQIENELIRLALVGEV